ncbi:integrase [Lysinibacillus sphaericus]|uniref:integrase n=1 Tax=Lysinibacillus sphaericus TaxID=1421 RepID=UPI001E4C314E|nr:integrase [Lysinibacillus sphaericus]UDK97120.1 integrase [Lysinibacillus sphaericus]
MGNYMNSEIPLNFKENPYTRTEWQDDVKDPLTGEIIEIGTTYMAEYANNFEWGIYNAYRFMIEMYRQMERMRVRLELDGRVPGNSGTFADTLDGNTNKIQLDKTMTEIIEAVEKGATALKVASVEGFTARTQVTIYDDEHSEDVMITEVGEDTFTVSTLAKTYKKGAKVARSNVDMDYVKSEMRFGDWQTFDVELIEVM